MTFERLHAGNPGPMTGDGNWTYLVPGAEPLLIDAGVGAASHLDGLARLVPGGPGRVLVTHAHGDHSSGAPALAARWPRTTFLKRPWPAKDPVLPGGWTAIDDGARILADDVTLEVLHTPGHSPDHLALWHADSRTVFTGDLVVLGSSVVIPASSGGSLVDYLASLRRLLALGPARFLPAHGPVIDDPEDVLHRYIAHRHQREQQVLSAVEAGDADPAAIVARVYPDVPPALRRMADETVRAHLDKLAHDGLARSVDGRWCIVR
jgi:glyoxylase-like metal-dependent hydrolase (beta-lactamase superfamily II)